jgi:hypothetical protein
MRQTPVSGLMLPHAAIGFFLHLRNDICLNVIVSIWQTLHQFNPQPGVIVLTACSSDQNATLDNFKAHSDVSIADVKETRDETDSLPMA